MYTNAMTAENEGETDAEKAPWSIAPAVGNGDPEGQTFGPGVYKASSALDIFGKLVLNGGPTDEFIFQVGSALSLTGEVVLEGGALATNVYWAVGSSATISDNSNMTGIVMVYASITMGDGASLNGAALAKIAAVTLVRNQIGLDGQASSSLATCTECINGYDLHDGQCIAIRRGRRSEPLSPAE
jgi:hypothetical protein